MPVKTHKSAFTYLGYSLLKCNYLRDFNSGHPTKLFIIASDVNERKDGILDLKIKIDITFQNNTSSKFEYLSQFIINDHEWFKKANEENQNLGVSNLFSIAFPYIRASISAITNDSLGGIFLPVINVLDGDITKGVSFLATPFEQPK